MKIYFSGSIKGGREKQIDYKNLINFLSSFGEVLDEHVGKENPTIENEIKYSVDESEHVYIRDTKWLDECDIVVAEVSVPSLGVGYEIAYANLNKKNVICLYDETSEKKLSCMIEGNKENTIIKYKDMDELQSNLTKILNKLRRDK